MTTNEFLAIATGGGANVESQGAYAADPVVPVGFALNAVPPSATWNKMLRQSSLIASMVAQAICDITGDNMLDDGTQSAATQLAQFKAMLAQSTIVSYSLGASGYVKFANGLILNWVRYTATTWSSVGVPAGLFWALQTITWPFAFPTNLVGVYGSGDSILNNYLSQVATQGAGAPSTSVSVYTTSTQNVTNVPATIFAWGY